MSTQSNDGASADTAVVTGKQLLDAEWQMDLENAAITRTLLDTGELGKRAPEIYENLGGVMCLLSLVASCHWGCRGGDHDVENLVRRCCNYAFAGLSLARLGFYDESLALIRGVAEVANLLELFAIDRQHLRRWKLLGDRDRKREYSPVSVRKMIEDSGKELAADEETYSSLCELGTHVTPETMRTSHQDTSRVHVGASFSVMGFLLVINELAINLSPVIIFAGYLLDMPNERVTEFREACNTLRSSCTAYARAAKYQDLMKNMQADGKAQSKASGEGH